MRMYRRISAATGRAFVGVETRGQLLDAVELARRHIEQLIATADQEGPSRALCAETRCALEEYDQLRVRLAGLYHTVEPIEVRR
jgi:hypothetical protein